jgi:hypothetical protein
MQKTILNLSLSLVLLLTLTVACTSNQYVLYRPVIRSQEELVVSDSAVNSGHRENIKQVFDFYSVPYREENGQILIPADVWQDRELMWNYTTKANDPDWLRQQEKDGHIKSNVTDLRLVGNAHPTIDKGFWRSPNAYFSAIHIKSTP